MILAGIFLPHILWGLFISLDPFPFVLDQVPYYCQTKSPVETTSTGLFCCSALLIPTLFANFYKPDALNAATSIDGEQTHQETLHSLP